MNMSQDPTTESNRSLQDELPTRSTTYTQTFLDNCVFDADLKALQEHLVSNPVQQSDLDRCLLRGLQIVQWKERELSHVAPALTILLQSGAKWNSDVLLDEQKTPYHIICESRGDHHELLDLMIKSSQKTIIDTQDLAGNTALLYAVRCVNINCLKCLIGNEADVNIVNDGICSYVHERSPRPWTALMEAIWNLCFAESAIEVNIFYLLLDSGADVNLPAFERQYFQLPITLAIGHCKVYSIIQKLIEKGACLDVTGYGGKAWAMIATFGNVELLKCMFNHGIDKDSTDKNGLSILSMAVISKNVDAVRYLLDLGVVIPSSRPEQWKTKDNILRIKHENQDPCMKAICYNRLDMVKLFEEYGSKSCELFTALRRAVINNSVEVVSYLLNKYTYPLNMEYTILSSHSKSIYTLFTEPRSVYNAEITKLLLDHGADPAKTMSATTSLNAIMTAIKYKNLKVIAQYIRSGVDINSRSCDCTYIHRCTYIDVSPFEASVFRGYHNVAKILLISGCSRGLFSLKSSHNFKNHLKPELKKLMKEWKVQENNVTPLQQRCRSVILNHLSPRADIKIEKLPLPQSLVKFLNISEIDGIVDANTEADPY